MPIIFQNDHERALWGRVFAGILTDPALRRNVNVKQDADDAVLAMREREFGGWPTSHPAPTRPTCPETVDYYEADRDPSDDSVIGGAPDDQGGTLHLRATAIACTDNGPDAPECPMAAVAEIGVNLGPGYSAAYLGPRDAREVAAWLVQWADWQDSMGSKAQP
jgi:hypothetical protein